MNCKTAFSQHVSESDVDWLLCIELNSNPDFREWFANAVFDSRGIVHEGAWRSVANSFGESDLVWRVALSDNHHAIALIENKIDAVAQPDQCKRYLQRGNDYVNSKECNSFKAVLISPEAYSSRDSNLYEIQVSYESIQEWFKSQEDERSRFTASMLSAAIQKAESMPKPDPATTQYRRRFWELAQDEFASLKLRQPGELREYWVWQDYDDFTIVYKSFKSFAKGGFYQSVVDLQLPGRASELEVVKQVYGAELEGLGGEVVLAGKSIAFRIEAQCAKPPAFDDSVARDALRKWEKLYNWWMSKRASEPARGLPSYRDPKGSS